jgi:hypothetical protein
MKLLPSQKDYLYNLIEKKGLPTSQFYFDDVESNDDGIYDTVLCYKGEHDFFCCFGSYLDSFKSENFIMTFSPGEYSYQRKEYPHSWTEQLEYFNGWINYLKREVDTPNKWERLEAELKNFGFNSNDEVGKFSIQEYEELKIKIIQLKEKIKAIELLPEQLSAINQKLDHLTEIAKDLNKFDWKSLFIGTIMSIIVQFGVTPSNAKSLWNTIKSVFNNYLLP